MSSISRENERFIRQAISRGQFEDRAEALDAAVALLRRRQELIAHVEKGTQQLRRGQFTEYDDKSLAEFREQIKADGRRRKGSKKKR